MPNYEQFKKEIIGIVASIKEGELTRATDESTAGGFWDLSYEITAEAGRAMMSDDYSDLQESVYNALWFVAEQCLGKDFDK